MNFSKSFTILGNPLGVPPWILIERVPPGLSLKVTLEISIKNPPEISLGISSEIPTGISLL